MHEDSQSQLISVWENGARANVTHSRDSNGVEYVEKAYRSGEYFTFYRELMALKYLGPRISCVPSVLSFDIRRRITCLEFVAGERVLEWVLKKFGRSDIEIEAFQSFHGLETNKLVHEAFEKFKNSNSVEAIRLREAVATAYGELHRQRFVHGDPSPRNLIYDGNRVSIIDFDHSRPSLNPPKIDGKKVHRWYGVSC